MAVARQPMTCPFCGHQIPFKYNKLTKEQMESGWCGDQGGDYDDEGHRKICDQLQRQNKVDSILGITQSEGIKRSMEFVDNIKKMRLNNDNNIDKLFGNGK